MGSPENSNAGYTNQGMPEGIISCMLTAGSIEDLKEKAVRESNGIKGNRNETSKIQTGFTLHLLQVTHYKHKLSCVMVSGAEHKLCMKDLINL